MRLSTVAILGVLLFAVTPAFGQHPDFTGNWKHSHAGGVTVYTVDQQDALLKIAFKSSYQAGSLGAGLSWSEAYSIDGSEHYRKAANGLKAWTTVNWQGSSDPARVEGRLSGRRDARGLVALEWRTNSHHYKTNSKYGWRDRTGRGLPEAVSPRYARAAGLEAHPTLTSSVWR